MQALDGFSLCLWQLGEADGALAGTNVFALLHRLSVEPDQLLRRSLITAVGALAHPGESKANHHPMLLLMHLPVKLMLGYGHQDLQECKVNCCPQANAPAH